MQKENRQTSDLDQVWMDPFQDNQAQDHNCFQRFFEFRDNDINEFNIQEIYEKQMSPQRGQKNTFLFEKPQPKTYQTYQEQNKLNSNSSQELRPNSSQITKKSMPHKQSSYSKTYRQRVKQKYKNLEDQNDYLKKRIKDLQGQLRYQQIQLCKLKLAASNKQIIEEDLSKQYVEQVDRITDQSFINVAKTLMNKNFHQGINFFNHGCCQQKNRYMAANKRNRPKSQVDFLSSFTLFNSSCWRLETDCLDPIKLQQRQQMKPVYKQMIIDFHTLRGFGGKKKFEILNYHFNELLQSLLKDSQKYTSLVFAISKNYDKLQPLPDFDLINKAFLEEFKPGCKIWSRLKNMSKFLQPMSLQINKHISQFHKKYEEILSCCRKIHKFMEEVYLKNMDVNFGILKSRVEKFFDFHKYGKMMRKLRYEWFQWMKSLAEKNEQQNKQAKKGYKKKKMPQ